MFQKNAGIDLIIVFDFFNGVMLIRNGQQEAFKKNALKKFEDEMVVHLAKFSPPLYNAIKEDQTRKVIQLGLRNADKYGFNFRGPVRLYLEMMLLFGSFFDTDPQYPWSREILADATAPQMQRAEQLYTQVCSYRQEVNGKNDIYTINALRGIAAYARKQIVILNNDFVNLMERDMYLIYPEKSKYLGSNSRRALINDSINAAKKWGISTERGNVLAFVLMLAFGHRCFEDPLYPWINDTVKNERIADTGFRVERLESKALTWLDHVLKNFNENV